MQQNSDVLGHWPLSINSEHKKQIRSNATSYLSYVTKFIDTFDPAQVVCHMRISEHSNGWDSRQEQHQSLPERADNFHYLHSYKW